MACLGVQPRAAGWKAQTNPLSYGSTPKKLVKAFLAIPASKYLVFVLPSKFIFHFSRHCLSQIFLLEKVNGGDGKRGEDWSNEEPSLKQQNVGEQVYVCPGDFIRHDHEQDLEEKKRKYEKKFAAIKLKYCNYSIQI